MRTLKSNKQIIADFNRNLSKFYENSNWQRREMYLAYQYRDCNQHINQSGVREEDYQRHQKPLTTVNMAAPIVRAVAGSEVMAANSLDYISTDPEFDAEADIISDVVEWCQHASDFHAQRAIAAEDAATCGIGAYVTYLDMTQENFIAGVPMCERVSPVFIAYDKSPRGSQLNRKARYCAYADPVSSDYLDEYIEVNNEEDEHGASEFKDYLLTYSYLENYDDVEFIYHYFWREFTDIFDVKNPFMEENSRLAQVVMQDDDVANMVGEFAQEHALDWQASFWTMDKESFDGLKKTIELIQLLLPDLTITEPEYSKRKGAAYYRAEIARGMLLKASRSYTQRGHPMNFITGYYEEATGNYYGMMRPLTFIQDYLNMTMSDFLDYARRATHGGSAYISGAADSLERIKKARLNEEDLTPVPEGANITPKALPNTPEVLINFINTMIEIMPRVLGLGQEFFGVITTGDMTDSLYGKIMKQSFAVLENWKNSSANSDMYQGYIFEDLTRLMADANDGMILPILSADNKPEAFMRLRKQSLAKSYAIRTIERPYSRDEKQDAFNKLTQLAPQAAQSGVNLFPILARIAPIDKQYRDEMVQLATPQPQQPDPLNQATMQANISYTNASAQKEAAQAQKIAAEVAKMRAESRLNEVEKEADIEETLADAAYSRARAAESVKKAGKVAFDETMAVSDRIRQEINNSGV